MKSNINRQSLSRFALFFFAASSLVFSSVKTSVAQDDIWSPYVDMNAYGSNDRWLGQANLFLPLEQSEDSMLFLDFRGLWTDDRSTEGNWGIGYRKILASERIVGVYGFFDHRSTS
ncbi:MAG: hypothetical protein COA78_37555, partial [Blastopirellula sp.]